MTSRLIVRSCGVLACVVWSLIASAARAQITQTGGPAPLFAEKVGVREFSGVLIARPLQVDAATAGAVREVTNFQIRGYVPETDEYRIAVPAGETENTVAARLMATGNFAYVEPDWIVFPLTTPNDPSFATQWHHAATRMNTVGAWDLQTGSPTIVVAICDTGIRTTHGDLRLNRKPGYNASTHLWENAGGAINDVNGHGTKTTGCAAANGNNAVGVAGVGWNLSHRMIRVSESSTGSASVSTLTAAARFAADTGDKVASVSYAGVNTASVRTTGTYIRSKGALLVWAAGNDGATMTGSRNDDVLVVGATDQTDTIAAFSNRGSLVDFVAPGVGVMTTSSSTDTAYASATGTSFSAPLVAGVCGLIWSRNPSLTPAQVESILRSTCKDLGTAGVDDLYGYGRINAGAALAATPAAPGGVVGGGGGGTGGGTGGDTTAPAAPTSLARTVSGASVTLTWAANTESDLAGYRVYRTTTPGTGYTERTSAAITARTFTDSGLVAGTAYSYVVRAQDTAGNLSANSAAVSATVTTSGTPSAPVVLFSDTFESGNLTAGGWTVQNTQAGAGTAMRLTGLWGAGLKGTTWMQKQLSTVGYSSITLTASLRTTGFDIGELLSVEWWNGSAWASLGTTGSTAWTTPTIALPAGAANQAALKIRFRSSANLALSEFASIDNVAIRGSRN